MERNAQEAAFIFAASFRVAVFDVEKFLGVAAVRPFLDDENFAGLIHNEKAVAAIGRFAHPHGTLVREFGQNLFEADGRERLGIGSESKAEQHGGQKIFHAEKDVRSRKRVSTELISADGKRLTPFGIVDDIFNRIPKVAEIERLVEAGKPFLFEKELERLVDDIAGHENNAAGNLRSRGA